MEIRWTRIEDGHYAWSKFAIRRDETGWQVFSNGSRWFHEAKLADAKSRVERYARAR